LQSCREAEKKRGELRQKKEGRTSTFHHVLLEREEKKSKKGEKSLRHVCRQLHQKEKEKKSCGGKRRGSNHVHVVLFEALLLSKKSESLGEDNRQVPFSPYSFSAGGGGKKRRKPLTIVVIGDEVV